MTPVSWGRSIADCFREQVDARPDATAVVAGEGRMSYAQLWDRAVSFAEGLACLGVERETLVGMAIERSATAVVAMVGISLAGGAYLPINPEYPAHRIAMIANLSGISLMVCSAHTRVTVSAAVPATVAVHDVDEVVASRTPGGKRTLAVPDDRSLAYVIYTSGSTGQPKGVMIEHRGVLRLVKDTGYFDFSAQHRFLQSSPLEFDAATFEVWGALLNGASLCVADKDMAAVPSRYRRALLEHGITVAWVTAPLFQQIVDVDPRAFAPLRVLLTGGDVVSPGHVNLVREHNPGLAVLNCYGPTENTTFTTVHPVSHRLDGAVPIGRPISGTTVRICDEHGRPARPGEVGELLIGGTGLARGYLNQAELNAAKFTWIDGERWYRSGDRARMSPDGMVHFHGRSDDQVKIRGNLVELAEVNTALLAVPGVREAYARPLGEPGPARRLVAYVVAPDLHDATITAAIRARLPDYLCPEQIIRMDRLPLNGNGKVDWRGLPAAPRAPAGGGGELTPQQRRLAQLWAQVLDIPAEPIGPRDRFTNLGGNSILVGTLLGLIGRRFGARLSFADALAAESLDAMSRAVESAVAEPVRSIPATTTGRSGAVHPQQRRLYAIWQAAPESVAYNVPARITIHGLLDHQRLRSAVLSMVEHHDAFRMRFWVDELGQYGGNGASGVVRQAMDGQAPEVEYRQGLAADVASFVRPFRLDEPPLLRAMLVNAGQHRHELYLDVHHIVFDGESLFRAVKEIIDRYAGVEPPIPAVRYADASQWYHDQLADGAFADDESYWLAALSDPPPPLALPTYRPRGARPATRAAVTRQVLDAERRADVERAARQHSTTVYVLLLAAYFAALARLSGQQDLIVGSPTSGRTHPDLDNVIGMFVGTACIRVRLPPDGTFADLVAQVAERGREALSHQNYPFDLVAGKLGAARHPGHAPLPHAFFALQTVQAAQVGNAALDASIELLGTGEIRFELNLQAHLHADRIVLELEYASDLYEQASARYLLDRYTDVLGELVRAPRAQVCPAYATAPTGPQPDFDL